MRSLVLIIFAVIACGGSLVAQENHQKSTTNEKKDEVQIVEYMPEPMGGMETFYKYIGENLKYPEKARAEGIEGKVFVQFMIDDEGILTEIKVIKSLLSNECSQCEKEAIKVVSTFSKVGKWKPATQNGKPMWCKMVIPIVFRLE